MTDPTEAAVIDEALRSAARLAAERSDQLAAQVLLGATAPGPALSASPAGGSPSPTTITPEDP